MYSFRLLCVLILAFITYCINAKSAGNLSFTTVGDNKLIPFGVVTKLMQDQQGYLWIGTQSGLIRYDGYRFRKFSYDKQTANHLAGNFVSALHQAHDGKIWIGTVNDGVSVFDPATEQFSHYQVKSRPQRRLSHNYVRVITSDQQGGIWIGTSLGLNYIPPNGESVSHFKTGLKNPRIRSLLIDQQGRILVGTVAGLYVFDQSSKQFSEISVPQEQTLKEESIETIFQAQDGALWLGTKQNGALKVADDFTQPQRIRFNEGAGLSHHWVSSIKAPVSNQIWVATFGGGITVLNAQNGEVIEYIRHDLSVKSSINLDSVSDLLIDQSGLLWIGTWGGGLNRINVQQGAFRTLRYSPSNPAHLSHPDVHAILELSDGRWLIGNSGSRLDVLDQNLSRIDTITFGSESDIALPIDKITALVQSDDNRIWLGTVNQGFLHLNLETLSVSAFDTRDGLQSNAINQILTVSSGLWLGTQAGLNYFDFKTQKITQFFTHDGKVFSERVNRLALDRQGNLWIATASGLNVLEKQSGKVFHFGANEQSTTAISSDQVSGLLVDSKNQLWVDTAAGLNRLVSFKNNHAIFESISDKVGFAGLYFGANLLEDQDGMIWSQWHRLNTKNWHLTRLIEADGIDVGTVWINSFAQARNGKMLFGGTEGVLVIDPAKFQSWQYSPQLAITELKIDEQPLALSDTIYLSAENKGFSLEFAALDFSVPENNRYAYRLVGYDENWIESSALNRRVSYKNLPPGSYRLLLKGSNHLGQWSNHSIELAIVVEPAWHQTVWFKVQVALLLFALTYLIYLARVKQLRRHKYKLQEKIKIKTQELHLAHQNLSTLSELGRDITATVDLNLILEKLYAQTNQLMQVDVFGIGIYREQSQVIEFELAIERGQRFKPYTRDMCNKNQLAVWVIENKRPLLINNASLELHQYIQDEAEQEPEQGFLLNDGDHSLRPQSYIYIPMIVKNKVVGVCTVQSFSVAAFMSSDLEMLQTLAAYAAIAIDNADKIHKLDTANKQLVKTQAALEDSYQKLEEVSLTDQLTGLKNRRFLVQNIGADIYQNLREYRNWHQGVRSEMPTQHDMVFFLIDLDYFKFVNDSYGHNAGDKVLMGITSLLKTIFRESDYLVRWGGEEFLAVARFTQRDKAPELAERIRTVVEHHKFDIGDERIIKMTCSIGFACFPFVQKFQPELTWEHIIEIADRCLYAAKYTQRNAWVGVYGAQENMDCEEFMAQLLESPELLLSNQQMHLHTSIKTQPLVWNE